MYYDKFNEAPVSDSQMAELGLSDAAPERLRELGFYTLKIVKDEISDPDCEGLRPAGPPMPDPDNEFGYIQHLEVYNFLDELKQAKLEELANRRWSVQSANFILESGAIFKSTPDDVARLSATLLGVSSAQARSKSAFSCAIDFKTSNGWITATVDELQEISDTISTYVQACYSNERMIQEEIEKAANLDELNAVSLDNGWPENSLMPPPEDIAEAESAEEEPNVTE